METNQIILAVVLILLCVVAIATVSTRNLLTSIILMSIFSLLMALAYLLLNAPDVAMTEAAIGGGVSTLIFLGTIILVGDKEKKTAKKLATIFFLSVLCGFLIYTTLGLPRFGDQNSIANKNLGEYYITESKNVTGIPNVVTSILASYRGFDTLGEVFVVFIAGISVLMILANKKEKPEKSKTTKN